MDEWHEGDWAEIKCLGNEAGPVRTISSPIYSVHVDGSSSRQPERYMRQTSPPGSVFSRAASVSIGKTQGVSKCVKEVGQTPIASRGRILHGLTTQLHLLNAGRGHYLRNEDIVLNCTILCTMNVEVAAQ